MGTSQQNNSNSLQQAYGMLEGQAKHDVDEKDMSSETEGKLIRTTCQKERLIYSNIGRNEHQIHLSYYWLRKI